MKRIGIRVLMAFVVLTSLANIMNAQSALAKNLTLNAKERSIATIAALTATGDLENLRKALNGGLDAGLTLNEIKEVLAQMYAYAGFPRSLNGVSTFMSVVDERMKKAIKDDAGKTATPIDGTADRYERGRRTLEKLSAKPESKPAPGFGEFSPTVDRFLKEHLFADIFDSDVLTHKQRELATISALAGMTGVASQLESHITFGRNAGLTDDQLRGAFDLIETSISKEQAEIARRTLSKVGPAQPKQSVSTEKTKTDTTQNETWNGIFPRGDRNPPEQFTGTAFYQVLAPKQPSNDYSVGSVTFEPGARSNWHTHPAGQTLIVIDGMGLYQEKGGPLRTIDKGETVVCVPNIEHWHGATPDSRMTHIAVTNERGAGNVIWLKPVSDEEYKAGR